MTVAMMAIVGFPTAALAVPKILAFGDSLTAGFGVEPEEAFPVRLAVWLKAHGTPVDVVDAGVSGDTSAGGLARLDWTLADHPDYALVELGANDMLRGIDPKVTAANLDAVLTRFDKAGIKVLFIGMRAVANWGADYQTAFDAIYPELAARHQVAFYPFFLEGVALDPRLNQGDGLHPNPQGVDVIVGRLGPYVQRLMAPPG